MVKLVRSNSYYEMMIENYKKEDAKVVVGNRTRVSSGMS